jgi:hypothetical protein
MKMTDQQNDYILQQLQQYISEKINPNEIEWIEEQEMMDWLKVSKCTLFRLRSRRRILFVKLGSRVMYPKQLIQKYFFNRLIK